MLPRTNWKFYKILKALDSQYCNWAFNNYLDKMSVFVYLRSWYAYLIWERKKHCFWYFLSWLSVLPMFEKHIWSTKSEPSAVVFRSWTLKSTFALLWGHFCSRVTFEKIWFHKFTICNSECFSQSDCLDEKWTRNMLKCLFCKNELQKTGTAFSWTFSSKSSLRNHNVFIKG